MSEGSRITRALVLLFLLSCKEAILIKQYSYCGPVLYFDKIVANEWAGQTVAPSREKALNNLAFRYKKQNLLEKTAKIFLPGCLIESKTEVR